MNMSETCKLDIHEQIFCPVWPKNRLRGPTILMDPSCCERCAQDESFTRCVYIETLNFSQVPKISLRCCFGEAQEAFLSV